MIIKGKKISGILLSLILLAVFILPVYAQPSGTPQITITQPKNGSILSPGDITVSVNVNNFNIVDKQGQAKAAGEGHIHYFMDVMAPTTPGKPAETANGTWVTTIDKSHIWKNVMPGKHNFSVELINNDHTPLTPPVVNEVNVTVSGISNATANRTPVMARNVTGNVTGNITPINVTPVAPSMIATVKITQPKNGSILSGGNATVSVSVDNFNVTDMIGKPNVAGVGHLVYLMDVKAPTVAGRPIAVSNRSLIFVTANQTHTWMNVTPGLHNFSVELVNNDNTTLKPPAIDTVNVTQTGMLNLSTALEAAKNKTANMTMNRTMARNVTPAVTRNVTPSRNVTPTRVGANVVNVVAKNLAFNTKTITVSAGAPVTINFDNQDSGVQHNIAIYQTSAATIPIYVGKLITGPAKTTYTFTAPSKPGTYFFRCDTHPTQMTGQFIVK